MEEDGVADRVLVADSRYLIVVYCGRVEPFFSVFRAVVNACRRDIGICEVEYSASYLKETLNAVLHPSSIQ